jgi:Zn-dependent peptidase ImmA (M78 family)/transcriptional regulator with XRE-family HTH domain
MIGERLRLARKRAGYSLRGLADRLGGKVTPQAIGKYERGEISPSPPVLAALADALGVGHEFLRAQSAIQLGGLEFRKQSRTSARERSVVESAVIEKVERYLYVEEALRLESSAWTPPFDAPRLKSMEAAEEAAVAIRDKWKLGTDPITNLTDLIEQQGIKVILLVLPERVSGLTCFVTRPRRPSVPVIVANQSHTLERRRLTMAHELAHLLTTPDQDMHVERAANRFAGAFLQPAEHVRAEVGKRRSHFGVPEVLFCKRIYRVSAAAFVVRLRDLGIISPEQLAYIFQTVGRGWRSTEPEPLEQGDTAGTLETPRRFERLCYRALSEGLIDAQKVAEFLGQDLATLRAAMNGRK